MSGTHVLQDAKCIDVQTMHTLKGNVPYNHFYGQCHILEVRLMWASETALTARGTYRKGNSSTVCGDIAELLQQGENTNFLAQALRIAHKRRLLVDCCRALCACFNIR